MASPNTHEQGPAQSRQQLPARTTSDTTDVSSTASSKTLQSCAGWKRSLSPARTACIVIAGFTCTFNANFGATMPSGALDAISAHFDVTNRTQLVLLNSLYMLGYIIGPLIFGPLSEKIGRQPVLIGTFLGYLTFMLLCSGAPTYGALLAFRTLGGLNAAAPNVIIAGLYSDVLESPSIRGNAMSLYMLITNLGALTGPSISGFSSALSWRWPFWIASGVASVGLPLVLTLPETFAPVLRIRHQKTCTQCQNMSEEEKQEAQAQVATLDAKKIFLRPFKLLCTEPVLLSASAYITLAYAVFYLMFQAYPIIFQGVYDLSPGVAGLAMLPVALGTTIGFIIFIVFTRVHERHRAAGSRWAQPETSRRLPLACLASPCMTIALFWLAWTVYPSVSPLLPMAGGVFFGLGFQLLVMAMLNFITDLYREYSASAHAASGTMRSIGAALLPLSTQPMYTSLGRHWPLSLLGFLALAMGVIPFIFIWNGLRKEKKERGANSQEDQVEDQVPKDEEANIQQP